MRLPIPPLQLKNKLVQDSLIAPDRFDALLKEAEEKKEDFLDRLVLEKIASADYLRNFVASVLGVEQAHLASRTTDKAVVQKISENVARQRGVIVFGREPSGIYDVAMTDPSDLETIEFLTQHLGGRIKPFLATPDDLRRGFAIYGFELGQDFKKLIEDNIQASLRGQTKTIEEAASLLPIVAIVDNLLSYAIASRASDIHLEILEEATMVRYRIDGILYEIMKIPKVIHSALVARLKLLAGLKIDEHYKPQDGRFRYKLINQIVDIRVAVMPTFFGEKVEMRLLEATEKPLTLEELGLLPDDIKMITENLKKAYGMVIICGPTGSGKTTTLYSLMNILNKPEVNVVTIEDPIEYNMRYVNQTQINPQGGITFASALKSFLRQDPNIIMVGEIRDGETANIAVQAALTGHLLLSSIHTNDAPTVIPRLFDLEVPPFLVTSVLNIAIAQRLVRKVCQSCIYSTPIGDDAREVIETQFKQFGVDETHRHMPRVVYKGKGCSSCGGTGYRGRFGIFEVLEITEDIKRTIVDPKFSLEALRKEARKAGMKTMFEDGIEKVQLALTTLEEVLRVIRE